MDATTAALLGSLTTQREHVLGILDELDDAALLRPVLPSGWSCAGLVRHLALDVERFWFRGVVAGDPSIWAPTDGADSAWVVPAGTPPRAALALYRAAVDAADEVIAATPLEAAPGAWPVELFGDFRLPDLRAILLHVVAETATHAGHLDAARELLDGRTWLILT